jgi:hypothetical protein
MMAPPRELFVRIEEQQGTEQAPAEFLWFRRPGFFLRAGGGWALFQKCFSSYLLQGPTSGVYFFPLDTARPRLGKTNQPTEPVVSFPADNLGPCHVAMAVVGHHFCLPCSRSLILRGPSSGRLRPRGSLAKQTKKHKGGGRFQKK